MRLESLASVAACATDRVCRLLVRGDPQERVWAAWTLAQRDPRLAADRIGVAFEHDSDIGVRRHLLAPVAAALEALDRIGRAPPSIDRNDTTRALVLYRPID